MQGKVRKEHGLSSVILRRVETPGELVAIVGDGQMALVLSDVLSTRGFGCVIVSPFEDAAARLERERESSRLPGFRLPDRVRVTADHRVLRDAQLVVCAIPTQFIRPTFERMAPSLRPHAAVVSIAKGIEVETFRLPCDILAETAGPRPIAALSGPTIAAELARRLPAVLVAASTDADLAARVQSVFTSPWTKIYQSQDLVGVELAGACKNVIAIAAGVADGLGLGTNTKSALLARGLAEIARIGVALGGRVETFFGVAGAGDLATTCFSPEGRNRSFGERLARGQRVDQALASTHSVVEGVPTARALVRLARSKGLELPICEAVEAMVFEGLDPRDALRQLMGRAATTERIG
ncbi:MAG: Glycerol-3-phosphate dehydrogenase [Planctomycetota bacterium]|jgi:glycerol-3-phosphate dehydrogenase (NAD(P)+)